MSTALYKYDDVKMLGHKIISSLVSNEDMTFQVNCFKLALGNYIFLHCVVAFL